MKSMNPIFSLKNFRSFGEDGASFELAPITILTGCNSAGKSSLVKALMLLSNQPEGSTWSSSAYDIDRIEPASELNISTKSLMLGQFDKVLHDKSEGKEFIFSYRIWSRCLQEEVIVKRTFVSNKDVLNNARLLNLTIEKIDGTLIYKTDGDHNEEENFCSIADNYNRFISAIEFLISKRDYTLSVEHEHIPQNHSQQEKEKIIEAAKQKFKKACDELKKFNYKGEDYSRNILEPWISRYCNPLEKSQIDTIIDQSLPEEEKEKKKKNSFISILVNEVISPYFTRNVEYINSSSAIINRLYSIENNNKINKALRIWNERSNYYSVDGYMICNKPGRFLNNWIKKFKIGDSIEIKGTAEGLGLLIYLIKKDGERRLLADEGYGITQLVSLLLQIDNKIKMFVGPDEDGQYVYPTQVICVEEPEVHLHPKYQSLLAEMFVEAYKKYNIHFIIETHSEYLIRKLQVMVADKENTLTSNDVSLNYVEKDENGVSSNRKIEILEDGRLSEPFGPGFFDEATGLSMGLLKMKMEAK